MMEKIIHTIRDLNKKLNAHIAILFDLQGPKIGIGDLLKERYRIEKRGWIIIEP